MTFCYVPILKWKKGEQTALQKLNNADKHKLLPLIELMPFEILSGENIALANLRDINKAAASIIKSGYVDEAIAIDILHRFTRYHSQAKLLTNSLNLLEKAGVKNIYPVVHPEMFTDTVEISKLQKYEAVVLRIKVRSVLGIEVDNLISELRNILGSKETHIHVLLDMFDMVNADPKASATAVMPHVAAAFSNAETSSVILAGGGFPVTLTGLSQGNHTIRRSEYETYLLLQKNEFNDLKFGDYAVTNPNLVEGLDPTKINPSCQIRYTQPLHWLLIKGQGSKTSGMGQYNQLCQLLIVNTAYSGKTFSFGDERFDYHAQPGSTSGSYMTWRRDATSHHLVFTIRQLKAMFGI